MVLERRMLSRNKNRMESCQSITFQYYPANIPSPSSHMENTSTGHPSAPKYQVFIVSPHSVLSHWFTWMLKELLSFNFVVECPVQYKNLHKTFLQFNPCHSWLNCHSWFHWILDVLGCTCYYCVMLLLKCPWSRPLIDDNGNWSTAIRNSIEGGSGWRNRFILLVIINSMTSWILCSHVAKSMA